MAAFSTFTWRATDAICVVVAALLMSPLATSAQVKVIISGGFSGPYERLLPEFERTSGLKVETGSGASQGSGPQTIAAQLMQMPKQCRVLWARVAVGIVDFVPARIFRGARSRGWQRTRVA